MQLQRHVRPLLLLAVVEIAALGWLAHGDGTPEIGPAMAPAFEGQGAVRISGMAANIRPSPDGTTRMDLTADGAAVAVFVRGLVEASQGSWVSAHGRVARLAGRLTLWVEDAGDVTAADAPDPQTPSWPQLAAQPAAWHGRQLQISGVVERGALADKDGHRIALGPGPWPKNGAVQAIGFLDYDASCLCERFTAATVTAVTVGLASSTPSPASAPPAPTDGTAGATL